MARVRSARGQARPATCSQTTELHSCVIAELPLWRLPKGSSSSRTSLLCGARAAVAIPSSGLPQIEL